MVAKEVTHWMSRLKGSGALVAIKLDVEKAYDTISWNFLEACMHNLCFHRTFIAGKLLYVTSVRYRVRINGLAPP